jgi:hypothetical protein
MAPKLPVNKDNQLAPDILFGRYSDNNKSVEKVNRWNEADSLFKEQKYGESLDAFFEYLRDDSADNVTYERNGSSGTFQLYQGSKMVRGEFDNQHLKAEVALVRMPQPSIHAMRRLLELNYSLYYSRFALENERLYMRFDSDTTLASPGKLYYALKELATKSDKQHDMLVEDFIILETVDSDHLIHVPRQEKEIKYKYLHKWVKETLDMIATLDAEKFSGGIAYMLLSLVYRIDYLLTPDAKLLNDLEQIAGIYFKKDDRQNVEKNRDMINEFNVLLARSEIEIFSYLFRSRFTFSIVAPQQYKTVVESIQNTNKNVTWYRENNYPFIAAQVAEYGISYCQYSYSLPRPIKELFHLYMMVRYPDFFDELGYEDRYYDLTTETFNKDAIIKRVKQIQDEWKAKYSNMDFKTDNLQFDSMPAFAYTFTTELEKLNMD